MNLQEAIDGPLFHTGHLQSSFFPRAVQPGHLLVEPAFPEATIETLRRKGHKLEVSAPWAAGRLCAVARRPDGCQGRGDAPADAGLCGRPEGGFVENGTKNGENARFPALG
jgi:gamma-glutamyltranspeptidase/glutathione hydrolase